MANDILSGFGPDSPTNQRPRATNGGQMPVKSIPYSEPTGPIGINDPQSAGLHGTVHPCGSQQED